MLRFIVHIMLVFTLGWPFSALADNLAVGEYSFVVGRLKVVAADGSERSNIVVGSRIYEGDVVSTRDGATVHLQFFDGAAVSLRPNSEIQIVRYRYNKANPAASEIKLDLRIGVARSISGKGAQAAKDKFRLNTPVAAIGVRGTDFVVSTTDNLMQAIVHSGGIVVASYSDNCTRASKGPCETDFAELFAGDRRAVQVTRVSGIPSLIELDQELLDSLGVPASAGTAKKQNLNDIPAGQTAGRASDITDSPLLYGISLARGFKSTEIEPLELDESRQIGVKTGHFGGGSVGARRMVWGRWFTDVLPGDQLIIKSEDARDGRQAVLGTRNFGLYRSAGWEEVQRPLTQVEFELTGLDSTLTVGERSRAVGALDGQLSVNLSSNKYSTQLDLFDAEMGLIKVESAGDLSQRGVFSEQSSTLSLAGAIDPRVEEAGYFFEKITPEYRVDGLTLWNAK